MTDPQASEHPFHACLIFERDDEQLRAFAEHIVAGLDAGERAVCLIHELDTVALAGALEDFGVDVARETAEGALQVVRARSAYLATGTFDPVAMIELVADKLREARIAGYRGLCAAGEMSWALEDAPGSERLLEYEVLLNATAFRSPLISGLCTYDARRFPKEILDGIRRAHPLNVATLRAPRALPAILERAEAAPESAPGDQPGSVDGQAAAGG